MFESLRSRSKSFTLKSDYTKQPVTSIEKPVVLSRVEPQVPSSLIVLFPKGKNEQRDIHTDIIAVHSLGGNAHTTWRHESGHLWLRDSLPTYIPNARIMTFSYDSAKVWCNPSSGIETIALELLKHLRAARQGVSERARRIVFICHGLGGVVVKKVLLCARAMKQYQTLQSKIVGVLFMGTPHRESQTATAAKLLRSAINCARVESEVRDVFLGKLEVAARTFLDISKASLQCMELPMRIISVYEQKELVPFGELIVQPFSAILGISNEKIIPTAGDHRAITRFTPTEEATYLPIRTALIEFLSSDTPITGVATSLKDKNKASLITSPTVPSNSPPNPTTTTHLPTSPVSPTSTTTTSPPASVRLSLHSSPTRTTATYLSTDSRGMPMSNRGMANLIETRIRNHAATRPESGVRAHGAAYHARRAHQERLAAQQEARSYGLRHLVENTIQSHTGGGVEAWRSDVDPGLPQDEEEGSELGHSLSTSSV